MSNENAKSQRASEPDIAPSDPDVARLTTLLNRLTLATTVDKQRICDQLGDFSLTADVPDDE